LISSFDAGSASFIPVKAGRPALLAAGSLGFVAVALGTAVYYLYRLGNPLIAVVLVLCAAFFVRTAYWHLARTLCRGRQGLLLAPGELSMLGPQSWSLKRGGVVTFAPVTFAANRVVGFKLRPGVRSPTRVLGGLLAPKSDLSDGFLPNYLDTSPDDLLVAVQSWLGRPTP
jgi:hypothetical protein